MCCPFYLWEDLAEWRECLCVSCSKNGPSMKCLFKMIGFEPSTCWGPLSKQSHPCWISVCIWQRQRSHPLVGKHHQNPHGWEVISWIFPSLRRWKVAQFCFLSCILMSKAWDVPHLGPITTSMVSSGEMRTLHDDKPIVPSACSLWAVIWGERPYQTLKQICHIMWFPLDSRRNPGQGFEAKHREELAVLTWDLAYPTLLKPFWVRQLSSTLTWKTAGVKECKQLSKFKCFQDVRRSQHMSQHI